MTDYCELRARRMPAWKAGALPLLLAACVAGAAPSQAAPRNTIRYIQPVISRGHVTTYAVCLYSTAEFPMRDEVITLSIGSKTFINSSYVQGGDLHTIIFTLSPSDYQGLKNGDPVAVFYGQGDSFNTASQWSFGTLSGLPKLPVLPAPIGIRPILPMPVVKGTVGAVSLHPMNIQHPAATSSRTTAERGTK